MDAPAAGRSRRTARPDLLRPLRFLLRLPLLALLILAGLLLTVVVSNPVTGKRGLLPLAWWEPLVHLWSRLMLRLFGFRTRVIGEARPDPVLFVANHVSWLDIETLHAVRGASFVAKAEIARWPLVGWLAAQAGTIFHQRGDTASLARVMDVMRQRLAAGQSVVVFPEGGTGRGDRVRPFHARIFQVALDTGVPVQPVALRYGRDGRMDLSVPFQPGEKFLPNALRLLGQRPMDAEIHFLPVLAAAEAGDGRRRLAEQSRARIAAVLDGDAGAPDGRD